MAVTIGASFLFLARYVLLFLRSRAPEVELIYTKPTEMLGIYMKVSLYGGLALALPFILYQLLMFVSPALTRREKKYVYVLLPAVFFCFLGGVLFAFFVLIPPSLNFLLSFGSDIARPLISIDSYISLLVTLLFWVGVTFELPMVMAFLSRIGIINPKRITRFRKYAFVGAFVLGAAITPTFDPINQTLVAGPIILLYEIGYWLSRLTQKKPHPAVAVKQTGVTAID